MDKINAWVIAARLRTLPLSISGVVIGSFLALSKHAFNWKIAALALFTTLFLQILSNLANDYGDSKNGKDTKERQGPSRMVQNGTISFVEMKRMIFIFSFLSLVTGIALLKIAQINFTSVSFIVLLSLGILAIIAALTYTIGKNPYGYSGWGDVSVFLFFGLFAVAGSFYLYTGAINFSMFFPAISIGAFSVGVLNINNLRDYSDDIRTGKITMVVKLGISKAKVYHICLLSLAIVFSLLYVIINHSKIITYLYVVSFIPIIIHTFNIVKAHNVNMFDKELKKIALSTILFSIIFGICINL